MVTEISSLVRAAERGDAAAAQELFATLYSQLHRIARRELARHGAMATVSPTTLLHEAYIDMASHSGPSFPDEARFMAYAARVMRGVVIDHARNRHALKRGGAFEITSMPTQEPAQCVDDKELSMISGALDELARLEPLLAEIVDLKFFCGFSFAEIAGMKGVSERTVQRHWDKARIYLHRQVRPNLSL